jgi:hypothetical protein
MEGCATTWTRSCQTTQTGEIRGSESTHSESKPGTFRAGLHNTESVYLLAPTKYRALELVGDYFAVAGYPKMVQSGNMVVRQIDLSEEQIPGDFIEIHRLPSSLQLSIHPAAPFRFRRSTRINGREMSLSLSALCLPKIRRGNPRL